MPRILHIADSHLCHKQYGDLRRGADFKDAVLDCIRIAHERGIKHIIHGGDLIDARSLQAEVGPQLEEIDRALVSNGIHMWVVTGNHDMCEPPWVRQIEERRMYWSGSELTGVDVGGPGIRFLDHRLVEIEGVKFFGLPSMSKSELLGALSVMPPDTNVLVWHGAVREFAGYPHPTDPEIADFPTDRLSAVLLGDQHINRYEQIGNCLFGYPGSTELTERGEDFEKFAMVLDVTPTTSTIVEKVRIKTRKALGWKIQNEEQVAKAMLDLEKLRGTPLLLFLNYADSIPDVPRRLATCFAAEDVIFRPEPVPAPAAPLRALMGAEVADDFAPEDLPETVLSPAGKFIGELFADDPSLEGLAKRLADDGGKAPADILSTWVALALTDDADKPQENSEPTF